MSETGQVIWFDRKKGFGFVRVVDPSSELFGRELFVHFSSIKCENNFKILYPGETVSMDVEKNTEGEGQKEFVVSNVTGVFNSPLMIDNEKYIFKVIRKSTRENDSGGEYGQTPDDDTALAGEEGLKED
jgi:cold shock CspA family protein